MLYTAYKLRKVEELDDPTIFIVVDRKNLKDQMGDTFLDCVFPNARQVMSVGDLKSIIKNKPAEEWKEQPRFDEPASAGQVQDKFGTNTGKVPNQFDTENHNIQQLVLAIGEQQLSVKEMMEALSLKRCDNFLRVYLNPAIEGQYVRLLYPNSPIHTRQKYFFTVKGIILNNKISRNK